jgi:xanthine dehydrogenase small subunit
MRNRIIFFLNGLKQELGPEFAGMMLADYLRQEKNLTGTKIVCAEGDCGACSVLRYFPQSDKQEVVYRPINSCITLVANMDGSSLVTVDALKEENFLHPVQQAMLKCHASQCGFCTPGFVVALTGLVEKKLSSGQISLSEKEAKNSITGNLCRCTGYAPIVQAALEINLTETSSIKKRFFSQEQEKILLEAFHTPVHIEAENFSFFAPKDLKEATNYLNANPETRIAGATTDLGVIHNKRKIFLNKILSLHLMRDLYHINEENGQVYLGARVTLSQLRFFLKTYCPEFSKYLDVFASPQIKNVATVVGNVANASPIGDTTPALLALDATIIINNNKFIPLSDFFISYRKTKLHHGEIITGIKFKLPNSQSNFKIYKNANRKDLDISAINLAINAEWEDENKVSLKNITLAAGGVAATPLRLKKTEAFLKKNLNIDEAVEILHSEFNPVSDVRATSAYRHILIENFLRRFFAECGGQR